MVGSLEVSGPSGSTPTCHAETTVRRGPRTLMRNLGRPAQPIQLRITQISVAGQELWQLDPHHVLLTAELLRDSNEYRRRITPVLQALL